MRTSSIFPALAAISAACILAGAAAPAQAKISIDRAEYAAGILVVTGETRRPFQRVVLDGRYKDKSNALRKFRFRIRYLPHNCTVSLTAGQDHGVVRVRGCQPLGNIKPKRPAHKILTPAPR